MPRKKSEIKQVNDVAKPGETAASPTARPVITGHGPMIKQDPMVSTNDDDIKDDIKEEDSLNKHEGLKIKPKTIAIEPIDSEEEKEEAPIEEVDKPEPVISAEASDTPEEEKPEVDKPQKETVSSDEAAIDSLADSAEAKKLDQKDNKEQEQKEAKIKELIESKKYNVRIIEGGHKAVGQKIMTWLSLILVVTAITVYLLVDAGYLDIGIDLPYDLIKD